ncbi:hypothetical protein [Agriterribacter sp.]|uniref:hypothetical protein n=1 Tax=Agriterribacter sp. TaxID=2821509 RepID=UPI002CD81FC3|nr:hypothetical protein [Agriterribacter sp.]HTN08214.1 hypothetical protein [Agriterribacter sp.]
MTESKLWRYLFSDLRKVMIRQQVWQYTRQRYQRFQRYLGKLQTIYKMKICSTQSGTKKNEKPTTTAMGAWIAANRVKCCYKQEEFSGI